MDAIDERDDEDQARPAGTMHDATEAKLHAPLVLLENPHAGSQAQQPDYGNHIDRDHDVPSRRDAPARGALCGVIFAASPRAAIRRFCCSASRRSTEPGSPVAASDCSMAGRHFVAEDDAIREAPFGRVAGGALRELASQKR